MIIDFKDKWLKNFYLFDVYTHQIPVELRSRLFLKLQIVDDATDLKDLIAPPSNRLERLKGKLRGQYAIRINRQWRLIFCWDPEEGNVSQLYLDNHKYQKR